MKLSEAILKGCETTQQCIGNYAIVDNSDRTTHACVMGAAAIGVGYEWLNWVRGYPTISPVTWLMRSFPELRANNGKLWDEAMERNDKGEARESIATDFAARGL